MQVDHNDRENLVNDGSTTSSVNLDSDLDDDDDEAGSVIGANEDDITSDDVSSGTVKKQRRQPKRHIKMDKDVVKFISNNKYSQELNENLEKLSAEVQLIPEKSLIIVTKKLGSRYIKGWHKRCCSMVTKFCNRFRKNSFELKESSSVRKSLPKLGKMLRTSNAAYWIESNKKLAVMIEQSEREQVLEKVREFLQILGNDGKYGCESCNV